MKTVFLLLLLLSTGGCAAKQWTTYLHHFAEGFQRAQEREIRLCWQAGCFWNGPGLCPRHGLALIDGNLVTLPAVLQDTLQSVRMEGGWPW